MMFYYVYFDELTKGYEIYQTRESNILGTYLDKDKEYVFAGFTRLTDASDYVIRENAKLIRRYK